MSKDPRQEYDTWKKKLIRALLKLNRLDGPAWWDGFHYVIVRNESSNDSSNPYRKELSFEKVCHKSYKAGAKAAESLLRALEEEAQDLQKVTK